MHIQIIGKIVGHVQSECMYWSMNRMCKSECNETVCDAIQHALREHRFVLLQRLKCGARSVGAHTRQQHRHLARTAADENVALLSVRGNQKGWR